MYVYALQRFRFRFVLLFKSILCLFFVFIFFTSSVLPELGIINLLKQLLCINRELISLSLLDWSEVNLLLRCCILGILLFPFIFIVYFVYDFVISN